MWQTIREEMRQTVKMLLALTLVTGLIYPAVVAGISQVLFPHQANGSLIIKDSHVIGSELIGQAFSDPKYFWSRPSATGPMAYNASASSGSNLAPSNPALTVAVKARITALQLAGPTNRAPIPVDLVTASGSGLDPHISPAAAEYQAARVAQVRHLPIETVSKLVAESTEDRQWGVFGEPRVNVLQLNLALDRLTGLTASAH
jgi:K+-transporting ATPase ATPase C chain